MRKIKFVAEANNGIINIPKKYQHAIVGKFEITVEQEEVKSNKIIQASISSRKLKKIVGQTVAKYGSVLKKLAKE
jgi:hypothetical protein